MTGGRGATAGLEVVGIAGVVVVSSLATFVGLESGEGVFALLFVSGVRGDVFTSLASCWWLTVSELGSFLACRWTG